MKASLLSIFLLLFISCDSAVQNAKVKMKESIVSNNISSSADSSLKENEVNQAFSVAKTEQPTLNPPSKKIVKTGMINFRVNNVENMNIHLINLIKKYDGRLIQNDQKTNQKNSETIPISADSALRVSALDIIENMVVKIPSPRILDFITEVSKQSVLVEEKELSTEDKSWDFLANQLKSENREHFIDRTLNGKMHKDDLNQILEREDEKVDKIIANRKIDEDVEMSTVNLQFYENTSVFKEKIPYSEVLSYKTSFWNRFQSGFRSGWEIVEEIILFLVKIWFILVIGFLVFFFFKKKSFKNWTFNKK